MTPADFQRGVDEGVVRHVGFTESIQMIADALVNALPAIVAAPPGLRSMRDMRLPSFYGGR
jgi:hypothetical protein